MKVEGLGFSTYRFQRLGFGDIWVRGCCDVALSQAKQLLQRVRCNM